MKSQIRTVLQAFRDALNSELFPGRSLVPKTLIFCKDDSHAEDVVHICREVFGKGNDFCKKITYQSKHPETGRPAQGEQLIQEWNEAASTRRGRYRKVSAGFRAWISSTLSMTHFHLNIFPINLPDVGNLSGRPAVSILGMRCVNCGRRTRGHTSSIGVSMEENGRNWIDLRGSAGWHGLHHRPETQKIRLRENLGVARQLVNESFIASFAGKADRKIVDVGPMKVLSSEKEHDFIAQAANGATVPPWLLVRLAHAIEARMFISWARPIPRASIRPSHLPAHSPALLGMAGGTIRPDRTYVSEKSPFNDVRIEPRARLVGRVAAVKGSTAATGRLPRGPEHRGVRRMSRLRPITTDSCAVSTPCLAARQHH